MSDSDGRCRPKIYLSNRWLDLAHQKVRWKPSARAIKQKKVDSNRTICYKDLINLKICPAIFCVSSMIEVTELFFLSDCNHNWNYITNTSFNSSVMFIKSCVKDTSQNFAIWNDIWLEFFCFDENSVTDGLIWVHFFCLIALAESFHLTPWGPNPTIHCWDKSPKVRSVTLPKNSGNVARRRKMRRWS